MSENRFHKPWAPVWDDDWERHWKAQGTETLQVALLIFADRWFKTGAITSANECYGEIVLHNRDEVILNMMLNDNWCLVPEPTPHSPHIATPLFWHRMVPNHVVPWLRGFKGNEAAVYQNIVAEGAWTKWVERDLTSTLVFLMENFLVKVAVDFEDGKPRYYIALTT